MKWEYENINIQNINEYKTIKNNLKISKRLFNFILKRCCDNYDNIENFIFPKLEKLKDPLSLKNSLLVFNRLNNAIQKKEKILIVGDYDVDGITSIFLCYTILKKYFNANISYIVPERFNGGYGLNNKIVEQCINSLTPNLILALDCGTNDINNIQILNQHNINVIIIDHHKNKNKNVEFLYKNHLNTIIINPHINNNKIDNQELCSVGLVFKILQGFITLFSKNKNIKIENYLDIVAIGTIADMVPLISDNRILTYHGFKLLKKNKLRACIQALFDVSGIINWKKYLNSSDISFKISPLINASGRLFNANLSVQTLLSENYNNALFLSKKLLTINIKRQNIEKKVFNDACSMLKNINQYSTKVIILFNESWHLGVLGIVASKLSNLYNMPSFLFGTDPNKEDVIKGSVRSIQEINIINILNHVNKYLISWGGHPMAAGISILKSNFLNFQESVQNIIKDQKTIITQKSIKIFEWILIKNLNYSFYKDLDRLQPFGIGNKEPIFGIKKLILSHPPIIFANKHFKFFLHLKNKSKIECIGWNMTNKLPILNKEIDIAFYVRYQVWKGYKSILLHLIDWKLS